MSRVIVIRKLTAGAFAPFGQILTTEGAHSYPINGGMTERFHDLANVEIAGENGRTLISIFRGQPYDLPLTLRMVERHPLGSQAFMPLHDRPFLVIVAHRWLSSPSRGSGSISAAMYGTGCSRHWIGRVIFWWSIGVARGIILRSISSGSRIW
jgi:ureidoglycolate lyase